MSDYQEIGVLKAKADGLLLLEACDRDTGSTLYLEGASIMSVNYDEHGSAGADLIRRAADRLAEVLRKDLAVEEVDDETYLAVIEAL